VEIRCGHSCMHSSVWRYRKGSQLYSPLFRCTDGSPPVCMFMTRPRINAQIATPSCGLFLTCRGKITRQKLHKICTYIQEQYTTDADFLY
jgi:hypothetical protein